LKSLYLIAFVSIISVGFVSCGTSKKATPQRLPGNWQPVPIIVDGKNNDWPTPHPDYDEKAMLGYAVSNDKDNLYIIVETGDLATQLKILQGGLTVWIDRKAEKNEETAINFPIPAEKDKNKTSGRCRPNMYGTGPEKVRIMLEDRVAEALKEAKEYSLQGFKACNLQYPIEATDSCGIMVRMAIDADNELVWEAVIPFKSFYFKPELTRADKGRALSICIETTGQQPSAEDAQIAGAGSSNTNAGRPRPAMSFGVGGMGMGMQMGGGGSRPVDPNAGIMEPLYKSTKTWKKFGLGFQ
jgi:hypothetical protein